MWCIGNIDAQISKRRGERFLYWGEAVDKIKIKNFPTFQGNKNQCQSGDFKKCKMFSTCFISVIDRIIWKFVSNLSMMYLRSKDSNSIIWTLSLERIIKSSILVPILRTDHSQIHESPLFPFFQRIEQLFVRVKNTLEYENAESYRKPYKLYIYIIVSFLSLFVYFI